MANGDYPILVFPEPASADRTKRAAGFGTPSHPGARRQAERLAPQFRRLQNALEKRRIALQNNSLGIKPEMVLVLETIGAVQDFFQAVKKVKGLEWLAEYEVDEIAPGDGFEDPNNPKKNLNGRLFLMMSDKQALTELQSLFDSWHRNPKKKFNKGLAPFKHAFKYLHKIRPWNVHDRLRETGLLDDWRDREAWGQTVVPFEAELWYHDDQARRKDAANLIRDLIKEHGGKIVTECVIRDIAYHAILGQIEISHVRELFDRPEARQKLALLQCDDVMFFRPVGHCVVPIGDEMEVVTSVQPSKLKHHSIGIPVVALFDGMPMTGHKLLDGRLVVDDPDGYEDIYQAKERSHGTAMASLICHGDLNSRIDEPLRRPIYVRPIMQPKRGFNGQFNEVVPENVLPVDLVHRAVVRMFDGEGNEPPTSPGVRVINLSIGDPARQFVREISGWARLLDWLSDKYNLLFVVSAGNHIRPISLETQAVGLQNFNEEERQQLVISAVAKDTRNRRLLSPAETLNGVTVGAIHIDDCGPQPNHLIDPLRTDIPNVISAHGPGYRRAIKPEIHLPGGRQLLSEGPTSAKGTILVHPDTSGQTGQCVAAPGPVGTLNATRYTLGTSNAAALGTREAYRFYELLESLRLQPEVDIPEEYDAVLMKTLLVHGAKWGEMFGPFEASLCTDQNRRAFRDYVVRFLGYGQPDFKRVVMGADQRVTVVGFGQLLDGEAAEFALPLPLSLADIRPRIRVIITLAWFSPIYSRNQKYRVAHLWYDKPRGSIEINGRSDAFHYAAQRGTLQHEIFEGFGKAVQDDSKMIVKVNCRKDANDILRPIRFGLAVTLEITENLIFRIPIYEQVRERLSVHARVPVDAS